VLVEGTCIVQPFFEDGDIDEGFQVGDMPVLHSLKPLESVGFCRKLQYICSEPLGRDMATTKTATLPFRIDPGLKEALRTAAQREHRSIANMVEVLIRDYCGRNGINISEAHRQMTSGQQTRIN